MFKTKNLIGILFGVLLLGASVSFVYASKLYLSPATGTFTYNCPFEVDVMLDMEDEDTTAMDLKMMVDESRYAIMNFDGQGGLFSVYTKPKYLTVRRGDYAGINTVYVFFSTFSPPIGVTDKGKLGTLTIKPHPGVWETSLNFYFQDGNVAEDSNVPALRNGVLVDSLDGVTNGYYTFEAGECAHESSYEVQMGGEFELVKNEDAQDLDISHILLPEVTAEDTMNFIKQYGWYILLVIVIILLIIFFKKRKKHQ